MTFAWPWFLLALVVPAALSVWLILRSRRHPAPPNLQRMLQPGWPIMARIRWWGTLLIMVLLILAAARPQWGMRDVQWRILGYEVVFVVDVSRSMDVPDAMGTGLSRLDASGLLIRQLLDRLPGQRVGIIRYAGEADVLAPLSNDHRVVRMVSEILDEGRENLSQSSVMTRALALAKAHFTNSSLRTRAVVVLTDGTDFSHLYDQDHDLASQLASLASEGIGLAIVGMGSLEGDTIPLIRDGSAVVLDPETRQPVISQLNEESLRSLATEASGLYLNGNDARAVLSQLEQFMAELEAEELALKNVLQLEDQFQVFVFLALLMLIAVGAAPSLTRWGLSLAQSVREWQQSRRGLASSSRLTQKKG